MSLHLPARRIVSTARSTAAGQPALHLQYLLPRTQRRNAWYKHPRDWFKMPGKRNKTPDSPIATELEKQEKQMQMMERLTKRNEGDSMFDDEIKAVDKTPADDKAGTQERVMRQLEVGPSKMKEHMQRALDPDPRWRIRYQKKKIIQQMRSNKPLTREQQLKRTERELTSQSDPIPTSTKKLVHLSHQIVGKSIDEAIVQMSFSKKKMAAEVKYQLEEARDEAIAARGMSLGAPNGQLFSKPKKILTKEGKWIFVKDPTSLYIEQSWVNKGPWRGVRYNYGARGRFSVMWKPSARIAVVLKEEKTRIRQYDEKVEKKLKAKPWVHLPNRPVYHQRPYYSW